MRFTLLTPGTGSWLCGSCLRDEALARALRAIGHQVEIVPLYLPFALEDELAAEPRVHMGGINLYLRHKLPFLRRAPRWIAGLLDHPELLRWASGFDGMTDAAALGELTLSMVRGEAGGQAPEIEELARWLASEAPSDVVVLSNALLLGLARTLKRALGLPLVCTLQGEAPFLDALPEPSRGEAWSALRERAQEVDRFVPVSRYTSELMRERLALPPERLRVVHNGIDARDLFPAESPPERPTIGFMARMCREKGIATLVDAFLILKRSDRVPGLRLRAAGVVLAGDRGLVRELEQRIEAAGFAADAEMRANVPRAEKIALLRSSSVLSVPATYGESFGLYLLEALACGLPVVQPRSGAFPELVEATGGGLLCEPDDPPSLADALASLLLDPDAARAMGRRGRAAVLQRFGVETMARGVAEACASLVPAN